MVALRQFKDKALIWAAQFETICFLDSNRYQEDRYSTTEGLLAVGVERELASKKNSFQRLKQFHADSKNYLFGFLSYDLKNEIEQLESNNVDYIEVPHLHFFEPLHIIEFKKDQVLIHSKGNHARIFEEIQQTKKYDNKRNLSLPKIKPRIPEKDYYTIIEEVRKHIKLGDFYEMNFCQEFYTENYSFHPLEAFLQLNELAKAPFSAYYKWNNRHLLCTSPERFLKKVGNKLISQPIKGTIKRGCNIAEDEQLKKQLANSAKNRSENVMIVDLVRNDLSRSCKGGTVKVEEMYGIYSFKHVHQMISTVVGELEEDIHFVDAIKNAFPMGSMTGAPKVSAMQNIEHYEQTQRGLYSGAVGYITPNGDFDFNVVIRSILYNSITQYLSFQVGGAIVYDSIPEEEYKECILKAKALLAILLSKNDPA